MAVVPRQVDCIDGPEPRNKVKREKESFQKWFSTKHRGQSKQTGGKRCEAARSLASANFVTPLCCCGCCYCCWCCCYCCSGSPDCDPNWLPVHVCTTVRENKLTTNPFVGPMIGECDKHKERTTTYREASSSSSELSEVDESPSWTDLLGRRRLLSWPDDVCGLNIERKKEREAIYIFRLKAPSFFPPHRSSVSGERGGFPTRQRDSHTGSKYT